MKQKTSGTLYVPVSRTQSNTNTLMERYCRSLEENCTVKNAADGYYVSAIACICLTFIFPPCVIAAIYCVVKAKKAEKGGKR